MYIVHRYTFRSLTTEMEAFLRECDLHVRRDLSSRFWDADETGFCTATASQRVLARRGSREVHEITGGSGRDYVTVLSAGLADGVRFTPYILGCQPLPMLVVQPEPCMGSAKVDGWRPTASWTCL